jgi:phosphoribosylanthranilate isomerase
MSIKVKICGITSAEDAGVAVEAGADLLGLVFHEPSPRHVDLEAAAAIAQSIPPYVLRVGLFVNAPPRQVAEAITRCGLQMLQFHGDETPDYCGQFGMMTMKAFRVAGEETLAQLGRYSTDAWLLDAHVKGQYGGTGHTFDWSLATRAAQLGKPVFLAGGLTPDNVAEAVRTVQPYGVDVSGGVERAPGRKDPAKLKAFLRAAREAADPGL